MTLRVGVCVSGRGTNLQAILDACRTGQLDARVVYVPPGQVAAVKAALKPDDQFYDDKP